MQVGGAAFDRIEQHLVDESHHRRIVGVLSADGVLLVVVDRFDIEAVEIDVGHVFETGAMGVEEFFDGIAELVVLHQDGFGAQPGAELDVVDCLVIARVGNSHEQLVAASPQGQGVMLAHQFFTDQAFGLSFFVQAIKVEERHAEVLGGDLGDLRALYQFVLHQIADQRQPIALGLLPGLLGTFSVSSSACTNCLARPLRAMSFMGIPHACSS